MESPRVSEETISSCLIITLRVAPFARNLAMILIRATRSPSQGLTGTWNADEDRYVAASVTSAEPMT